MEPKTDYRTKFFFEKAGKYKAALLKFNKSQEELAAKSKLSENTVSALFAHGKATSKTIAAVDRTLETWAQDTDDREWVNGKVNERVYEMDDRLDTIIDTLKADPHLAKLTYHALEMYKLLKGE